MLDTAFQPPIVGRYNSHGVMIREWAVSIKVTHAQPGDYTILTTRIYHTNDGSAMQEGAKVLAERLAMVKGAKDSHKIYAKEVKEWWE